ncbi:MAG TPA: GNAT family N-acetyltransferase [Solirubrobacteraceae bacterium]|nr:GNAT family N-acetyltransferase [Solirubrobacteraceae bacterium]
MELALLEPASARALAAGINHNGHPWASGYPLGSTLICAELTAAAAAQRAPLGEFGTYQVIRRADGNVIGDVGFMGPPDDTGAVLLGCAITEDARGQGYATEALSAMVEVAKKSGLRRLYALCHRDHHASARVLEKCDFAREGVLRAHVEFPNLSPGEPQDVACYAILL